MRVLLQRVTRGSVHVAGELAGEIGPGHVLLVGVSAHDGPDDVQWLANKVAHLRLFSDEAGKMNRSLLDINGQALVISQFTLYADARKGRRPSFVHAADPEVAAPLVEQFATHLEQLGVPKVARGRFGAYMQVGIENDGPVTLWLDSNARG